MFSVKRGGEFQVRWRGLTFSFQVLGFTVSRIRCEGCWVDGLAFRFYLEGQEDLVIRQLIGIIRVTIWVIGVIKLLTKSL